MLLVTRQHPLLDKPLLLDKPHRKSIPTRVLMLPDESGLYYLMLRSNSTGLKIPTSLLSKLNTRLASEASNSEPGLFRYFSLLLCRNENCGNETCRNETAERKLWNGNLRKWNCGKEPAEMNLRRRNLWKGYVHLFRQLRRASLAQCTQDISLEKKKTVQNLNLKWKMLQPDLETVMLYFPFQARCKCICTIECV